MDTPPPPLDDAAVAALLRPHIESDAHPATLDKAVAFYKEIYQLSFPRIAVLLAWQQIMLEGFASELQKLQKRATVDQASTPIIKATSFRKRY